MNMHVYLVLRHSCLVQQHFCFMWQAHLISVMAPLHGATTLLFRIAGMSYQCFGTSVQYCTVPLSTYFAASLSFIVTSLCRQTFI